MSDSVSLPKEEKNIVDDDSLIVIRTISCEDPRTSWAIEGKENPYKNPMLRIPDSIVIYYDIIPYKKRTFQQLTKEMPGRSVIVMCDDDCYVRMVDNTPIENGWMVDSSEFDSLKREVTDLFISHEKPFYSEVIDYPYVLDDYYNNTIHAISVRVYYSPRNYTEERLELYPYINYYQVFFSDALFSLQTRLRMIIGSVRKTLKRNDG